MMGFGTDGDDRKFSVSPLDILTSAKVVQLLQRIDFSARSSLERQMNIISGGILADLEIAHSGLSR